MTNDDTELDSILDSALWNDEHVKKQVKAWAAKQAVEEGNQAMLYMTKQRRQDYLNNRRVRLSALQQGEQDA